MKNAKKILSIVLAVVLALSTMAVAGFALEAENASKINVKYTVSQTNSLVEAASGTTYDISGTAYAGDVYAVTISVKAAYGISYLQVPFFYNQDKFGQVTLFDGTDVYYVYNGYNADMTENVVYMYDLGPAWDDAGQYKADGSTAANALQTKCFGLGHASAAGAYTITAKSFDQTTTGYDLWTAGIAKDFNVAGGFITLSHGLASKAKAAFLNVVNGKVVTDSYVDVVTFYVYNHSGEDVTGEEIGAYVDYALDSTTNVQTVWDAKYSSGTTPRNGFADGNSLAKPWVSFVENGEIKGAPSPVYAKGSQIRFNGLEENGAKANFDVRTRAALTAADFAEICTSEDNAKALAAAGKLQVGFVYTAGTMDVATAKAVATGTAADGYYNKPVTYIQSTGTEYVWTCLIKNADYNDSVQALGYIIVDGTAYYFDAASTTTFSTLYGAWYDDYAATQA